MNPNARTFAFNAAASGYTPPSNDQQSNQQGGYAQQGGYNQQQGGYDPNSYYPQGFGGPPPQNAGYYQSGFNSQGPSTQQPGGVGIGGGYYGQQQQPSYQGYPSQQQQQQQPYRSPAPPSSSSSMPPRPAGSGLPPKPSDSGRKPVSLSLGGGSSSSSSTDAPRKPVSLSIGGGSKPASSSATPEKKPVSISIGGGAPKASPAPAPASASTSVDKPAAPADPESAAPAPVAAVSSVKAEEAIPADASAPTASTPRPASPTPAAAASSKGGKSAKQSAKVEAKVEKATTDAEKILAEAKQATDEETLKDLFGDKADEMKSHLNIVFIGHVDAGKSTMGGNLLYLTGMVDKRTLEKFERESKEAGRESWYLSWALDSTSQEREKGKTVEVGRGFFETGKRRYTILDAPGHKTYVPAMISGAAQADVALLVISARRGEFETGFEKGGQTREHAMLVKTAGVQRLVVVVNKMDEPTVGWSKERYDEIVGKLTPFLRSAGFNPKTDVTFIPVSGFAGHNLKDPVSKDICSWYSGPPLLGFLDDLSIGDRKISEPLKMPVSEKYADMGTVVVGKLESGKVKKGDSLLLMPNKTQVEVMTITNEQEEEIPAAISGDNVRIKLKGVESEDVSVGFVLTDPKKPVAVVTQFEAQLAILEHRNIIAAGYSAVMHIHTASEEITIPKLLHYYDKKTGRKSKKPPQFAKKGQKIVALIETSAPICLEKFNDYPQLGRFTVRDEGRTVGIGKVTKLISREEVAEGKREDAKKALEDGVGGLKIGD